jgi:hypothetical protein
VVLLLIQYQEPLGVQAVAEPAEHIPRLTASPELSIQEAVEAVQQVLPAKVVPAL